MKSPEEIVRSIIMNAEGHYTSEQAEDAMVEALQAERDMVVKLKGDLAGLLAHHEATDQIIADAKGRSPENGAALLYNMDQLKIQLADVVEALRVERGRVERLKQLLHKYHEIMPTPESVELLGLGGEVDKGKRIG